VKIEIEFKLWLEEDVFRFDPAGNITKRLLDQLKSVRQLNPEFDKIGDDQIEKMLYYSTPEEIAKQGPERSMELYDAGSTHQFYFGDFT